MKKTAIEKLRPKQTSAIIIRQERSANRIFASVKKIIAFTLLILALHKPGMAGDSLQFWRNASSFSGKRLWSVAATEAAGWTGSVVLLSKAWYNDFDRSAFHFFNDNSEWRGMDKAGHFVTSCTIGNYGLRLLRWSGVRDSRARWYGGTLGLLYLGTLEMFDAYSVGWGFSWGDMLANTSGAAVVMLQDKCWNDQRIRFKYSFRSTGLAGYRPDLLGSNRLEQLVKDYNSMTYWASFSPGTFGLKQWPSWLCMAAGYSAEGMVGGKSNPPLVDAQGQTINFKRYSQFALSLDIDLSKLPIHGKAWALFAETFGFVKIPAPGIIIGNGKMLPRLLCY